MKIAGWICLIFGVLSFLGAAVKGNSVFGPCVFIALGVFFILKSSDNNEHATSVTHITEVKDRSTPSNEQTWGLNPTTHSVQKAQEPESLEEIQSQLSLSQREAAMCLVAFFGGYNENLDSEILTMLSKQAAHFFGIDFNPISISHIMGKYSNSDVLIDTVIAIKPQKAKEFLLLTCYDIVKTSGKDEPMFILRNIASDMGYDSMKFALLINKYKA